MMYDPRRLKEAIRFLREHGDSVEPAAGSKGYIVNGTVALTPEEVIARADRLRARGGRPGRKPPTR
jgi:hypothetical protein